MAYAPPSAEIKRPPKNGQTLIDVPSAPPKRSSVGIRLLIIGVVVVLVLAGALLAGTLPRQRQTQHVNALAAQTTAALPRVTIAIARHSAADAERVLPGNSLPLLEASLYARTTGYVKTRLVDIGDRVKEGQVLAEISAPDVDDQLAQAKANLELSKANLKFAQANARLAQYTLDRDLKVIPSAIAPQQIDQDRAALDTSIANVSSSEASIRVNEAAVQRYTDLQGFQKIIAPFPGVITSRHIDPGDLVTADSTARELFHLMRTDTLRVFVNVPQVFAAGIKVGQEAVVHRREEPHTPYPGKVTRTADALDSNTRTLLTEVQVTNPKDALRPGMYLQVKFVFDRQSSSVLIPAAALATRSGGPRVGVLDDQKRVHYRVLQLGRDYGAEVEVLAGLTAGETVVVHPGDDIPEGTAVEPVSAPG